MNATRKPAKRLTAESILRSFQSSSKKHLFFTGVRGSGKSTLAKALSRLITGTAAEETPLLPGITTAVVPGKHVLLTENGTNRSAVIGTFSAPESDQGNRMRPVAEGFFSLGIPALKRATENDSDWICIDEFGYLETDCQEFQEAVCSLLEKKRVLAVVRKQDTPFLTALIRRNDAFVIDLDHPIAPIGCVIMASGLSRRFGSNKLLADFHGKPLISRALEITGGIPSTDAKAEENTGTFSSPASSLFAHRVVVTRTPEVQAICRAEHIPVLLHSFPDRSDTVRLGMQALSGSFAEDVHMNNFLPDDFSTSGEHLLTGYMFCPADQPLISRESMETLCLTFSQNPDSICRLGTKERPGAPVIFPKRLSEELLTLPKGTGGSFLAKKYPEQVLYVPVRDKFELLDADTPETLAALAQIPLKK